MPWWGKENSEGNNERNGEEAVMEDMTNSAEREKSAKTLTTVIYALYAASLLVGGITGIVAIVINYVKKDDVAGTFLESHFRWQIRTFWFGLRWAASRC